MSTRRDALKYSGSLLVGLCALLGAIVPQSGHAASEQELINGAQREGKVLWYASLPTAAVEKLSADFEKKYNIKVEFLRLSSLAVVQRIYAEQERKLATADVVHTAATEAYPAMKQRGWLAKISDLPEWSNIPANFKDAQGMYVVVRADSVGIIYNKKGMADKQMPHSLAELAGPAWQGKLVVGDPSVSGAALLWARWVIQHPKLGYSYLERLRDNDILVVGQTGRINDTVSQNARVIGVMQQDSEYSRVINEGVSWTYPEEGFATLPAPAAVMANAPRPQAARLFLNFLISKEAQEVMVTHGYNSSRLDIDSQKNAPWKRPLNQGWQPDWEKLTEADTKNVLEQISRALKGR